MSTALSKLRKKIPVETKKTPAKKTAKKPNLKVVKSTPKKAAKAVKAKPQKQTQKKAAVPAKSKVIQKVVVKRVGAKPAVPTIKEINKMNDKELNAVHDKLPGEIKGWGKLDVDGKRKTMIAGFHSEEEDTDEEVESGTKNTKKKAKEADEDSDEDSEEDDTGEDSEEEDEESEAEDAGSDEEDEELSDAVDDELEDSDDEEEGSSKANAPKAELKPRRKFDPKDLIDKTVKELEKLSEDDAEEEFRKSLAATDDPYTYFRLGGVLSVMKKNNFIGDHETFREKLEADTDIGYRKAEYLIDIYDNLVASGVKWDDIKTIGWSKMKEISHLITPDNVAEWVEKCSTMNRESIIEEVKLLESDDAEGIKDKLSKMGESKVSTMSFKVHADQKEVIEGALEKAKEMLGTEVNTVALEGICADFMTGSKKVKTRDMTFKQLCQKYLGEAKGKNAEEKAGNAIETMLQDPCFEAVFGYPIQECDFKEEAPKKSKKAAPSEDEEDSDED